MEGNAVVFTQGGPTAVINASWVGVVEELNGTSQVDKVYGAAHGIDGILKKEFFDLSALTPDELDGYARTPSSALLSTRHRPTDEDNIAMLEVMRDYGIRYVFGIGGNDTSDALNIINEAAKAQGYELRMFHVPKTVDCDLMENDHTPGYGSAARFVARSFMGVDLDNKCFGGIYLGVCMGRHAGFLTAASALGRKDDTDGPHLVYLPERPMSIEKFLDDVCEVYNRLGRCVIAVSEGVETPDGKTVLETLQGELDKDTHGNVQLSGTGALADALIEKIKKRIAEERPNEELRARGDTLGYLQRSYPDQSEVDLAEARESGRFAAKMALAGNIDGSVTIKRESRPEYKSRNELVELTLVAGKTRLLPDEFISPDGNNVTQAFIEWGRPLVGDLGAKLSLTKPSTAS